MMRGGCTVESSDNRYPVIDRIMLKFRPIAPKPAGGEDVSAAAELERRTVSVKIGRRSKRKYVRVRGRKIDKRKTMEESRSSPVESGIEDAPSPVKSGIEDAPSPEKGAATTLQLLPERSESDRSWYDAAALNFGEIDRDKVDGEVNYHKADVDGGVTVVSGRSVVRTWVVVERVTETQMNDGVGRLGSSDRERIRNLQADTCPGFVSDGSNNVVWVNEAYRKMVAAEKGLMVWLVVKEKLPYVAPAFACRVRMVQQTKHGHKWNKIVPCDVWRMEFAGFAWKLDVKTALSLGI